MKIPTLFLAIGIAFVVHGWYGIAAMAFIVATVSLVALLPPGPCIGNCEEGRKCACERRA